MGKKIYTYVHNEHGKQIKKFVGNDWSEVIDLGWLFRCLDENNHVWMTRRGYLNEFWQEVG